MARDGESPCGERVGRGEARPAPVSESRSHVAVPHSVLSPRVESPVRHTSGTAKKGEDRSSGTSRTTNNNIQPRHGRSPDCAGRANPPGRQAVSRLAGSGGMPVVLMVAPASQGRPCRPVVSARTCAPGPVQRRDRKSHGPSIIREKCHTADTVLGRLSRERHFVSHRPGSRLGPGKEGNLLFFAFFSRCVQM